MTIADIVTRTYFLTGTDSGSYTAADMLISINRAYNHIVSLVLKNDSRWQWDDTNQTDLPIATAALVSGQQDYSLATTHLTIDRIEIKDTAGNWTELRQIDQQLLKRDRQIALGAYQTSNGIPTEYDLLGGSVFLYPSPNYSQASSLKIYFTRGPVEFTSAEVSTGTKEPGFNSLFHDLISLWAAYDYALAYSKQNLASLFAEIQRKEQQIEEFYGKRNRDIRGGLRVSTDSNK